MVKRRSCEIVAVLSVSCTLVVDIATQRVLFSLDGSFARDHPALGDQSDGSTGKRRKNKNKYIYS